MAVRRNLFTFLAITLCALAAASACSSGTDGSSESSRGARGTTAAAQTIRLGVICVCSGPLGSRALPGAKATEAWAKSVNAAGGLNGHPIDLIVKDDAGDPGKSLAAAKSLIATHVVAILDITSLDMTWQKEVDAAKIPVIGGNTSTAPYYQDPNWYSISQTNDSVTYANVATAKLAAGGRGEKVGLLYCAEAPQCQDSVALTKAAAGKIGLSLAYSGSIAATAPNYTAQCLAAKQAGVKALIVLQVTQVFVRVAQDCARQGFDPAFVAEGTGYSDQILGASALADSYWASFPTLPYFVKTPQVTAMNRAVDKYQPGLRQDPDKWSQIPAQAWVAGVAVQKAVKAANITATSDITSTAITRGLETFSDETLGGWSPPLTFTSGRPHPIHCWYTARVKGGKPTLVNGGKLTCQETPS